MIVSSAFLYERKHFLHSKAKVVAYVLFVIAAIYALYNGFTLQKSQEKTIQEIRQKQAEGFKKVTQWYQQGKKGPEDRPWVNIEQPFWALWNLPTYAIKQPSPLLPLGIGQTEQYAYYKRITNWSTTYDTDMVEELANPERLTAGTIDFSFLVLYLSPLLLIIFIYNIYGLETDLQFDKLLAIQVKSVPRWIAARTLFYFVIIWLTLSIAIWAVAIMNNAVSTHIMAINRIWLLTSFYLLGWCLLGFTAIIFSKNSKSIAFTLISGWLIVCVLIPGGVHQWVHIKHPTNYMTDYLDANRKQAYAVYDLSATEKQKMLTALYPFITQTKAYNTNKPPEEIIDNTVSAIINQQNKKAIAKVESGYATKNKAIEASYWYNPVVLLQNTWNGHTGSSFYDFQVFRNEVQQKIDKKILLLVQECWQERKVNESIYQNYRKQLI
ncbi:MAG: hypothetical protein EAZ47_02390 [Bacteroidetes bacterium]|nr:MAG: hypothetical protein EAZ47_02390 [Bacteroidota bacterium]